MEKSKMTQVAMLQDVAKYISEKVTVDEIALCDYVSTENLLQNKGGIVLATNLPKTGKVTRYRKGDVLISNIRPYFKKIWFADRDGGASNDVLVIRTITNKIIPEYLYYVLANDRFFDYSTSSSGGSKMPRGDKIQILKYPVCLPSLSAQSKIADTLSSVDKKIELNRKMNETLEQIAQAFFHDYFLNADGSKAIDRIHIGSKIHPKRGKSLQSKNMIDGVIPVISGGLKPAGYHDVANTKPPVITVSASGANAGFVALWNEPVWSADSCFIDTTITKDVYFYYLFMKSKQNIIYGMQTGSGQPHIYPKHIELLEIPNAPEETLREFDETVAPLFTQINNNKNEIKTLTKLRDALLPQLVSGKVKCS